MRHGILAAGSLVLGFLAAPPLAAHHSPSAIFDMGKRVAISGTLSKVDWVNPHIVLIVDAKGDGGKVDQWTFESNPPTWFRGVGLARIDFAKAIGHTVTIEALPARDGAHYGYMQKITLPEGTTLELVSGGAK